MIRYFEQVGKRVVMKLDLKPPASTATVAELAEHLKMEIRELDREEYNRLAKEYTK